MKLKAKFVHWLEPRLVCGFEEYFDGKQTTYKQKSKFVNQCLRKLLRLPNCNLTFNFIITSKAEIRVFEPLLFHLAGRPDINANVVYLCPLEFGSRLVSRLEQAHNVSKTDLVYPLIASCFGSRKAVNVICLDHVRHAFHHRVGISIISAINARGGKSVCLQHGSTHTENVEGHRTSVSTYQIVWGKYIYRRIMEDKPAQASRIFVSGNPLHDHLFNIERGEVRQKLESVIAESGRVLGNRKIIMLATCLHTEYEDRDDPAALYRKYIRRVYESVDFDSWFLIVKMHPSDSTTPNIYADELPEHSRQGILILPPDCEALSFYDLVKAIDLLITRASTVAEEALLVGTPCLAYDLFEDGPSTGLTTLKSQNGFRTCVEGTCELRLAMETMLSTAPEVPQNFEEYVAEITYKLDGQSTARVCELLRQIAYR